MDGWVGGGVVDEGHISGFLEGIFIMLDDSKEGIYGIVGLCVGFCAELAVCEGVKELSVCCQPSDEETFKKFSEGVVKIYTSVGRRVSLILTVSFVDRS